MSALSAEKVLEIVREAVVTVLEVDPGAVTPELRLVDDLDADSLALVEIAEILEERLGPLARNGFRIDDADIEQIRTVGEAVDYAMARL